MVSSLEDKAWSKRNRNIDKNVMGISEGDAGSIRQGKDTYEVSKERSNV